MSLTSSLMDLGHAPQQPDPRLKMVKTAEGLLELLGGYLPEGWDRWDSEFKPWAERLLQEAVAEVRAAAFAGEIWQFIHAVERCTATYIRAAEIYGRSQNSASTIGLSTLSQAG